MSASLRVPLLPSKPRGMKQGQELRSHVTKRGKKKRKAVKGKWAVGKSQTAWRVWKNLLRAPNYKHVITVQMYKREGEKKKNRNHMMRSQYILSLLPSLFSPLPPFSPAS